MADDRAHRSPLYILSQKLLLGLFRAFYLFEVKGLEHIPATGPVIIAANHINIFDALMIAACVPRRMRFVVWNRTFTLPVIGWFLRVTGGIAVDREKPDPSAFKESVRWLRGGNVLGIFPEGTYTTDGHLMPIKHGTARMALTANATVVPATLVGAYRSWPKAGPARKLFPRPWKVVLKFQEPIPAISGQRAASREQRAFAEQLTGKIADAINQTLEPSLRAEEKVDRLVGQPASHVRIYEWFFCLVLLVVFVRAQWDWWALIVAAAYFAYLLADVFLVRQSRRTRAARNFSPVLAVAAAVPSFLRAVGPLDQAGGNPATEMLAGLPKIVAWLVVDGWFLCYFLVVPYLVWAMIAYCFRKYLQFQRYVRGLLVTLYFCLLELLFLPFLRYEYPLPVDPSRRGLYGRLLELLGPMSEVRWFWLPSLIVSLSAFTLLFDFAHDRKRFRATWFLVVNAWLCAVVLRGYPLPCLAINFLTVALVFAYLNVFKFRAHDGRRI